MKRWKSVLLVLTTMIGIVVCWLVVDAFLESRARVRREAGYESRLSSLRKEFPSGMARHAVEAGLRAKGTAFVGFCCDSGASIDRVHIGQEPTPWYCSEHSVDIEFRFSSASYESGESSDRDVLRSISLAHSLGGCL